MGPVAALMATYCRAGVECAAFALILAAGLDSARQPYHCSFAVAQAASRPAASDSAACPKPSHLPGTTGPQKLGHVNVPSPRCAQRTDRYPLRFSRAKQLAMPRMILNQCERGTQIDDDAIGGPVADFRVRS